MELLTFWDGEIPADYEICEEKFYFKGKWKYKRKRPIYIIYPKTENGRNRIVEGELPRFNSRKEAEKFREEQLELAEIYRHREDRSWIERELEKFGYSKKDNEGYDTDILFADLIYQIKKGKRIKEE